MTTQPTKEGHTTSEFYAMIAAMVGGGPIAATAEDPIVQAAALIAVGLAVLGYQLSRGSAKKGVAQ